MVSPSDGWLSRWKVRNNISYKRTHGESKDADTTSAAHFVENVLPTYLREYSPEDIYNADETGLYYRALPDGTFASKSEKVQGSKKSKDRITAMICCNMTGTDKRQLLIIGKSKQPRCFRGKYLPVTYSSNSNAWMTSDIFKEFVQLMDKEMRRKKRNIILFVDNQRQTGAATVRLVFLPPNTTSIIQPCDQGNFKTHYRSMVINSIIDDIDNHEMTANDVARKLTLLNAVHLATRAWAKVKETTIVNCFRKGDFHLTIPDPDAPAEPEDDDQIQTPPSLTASVFDTFVTHDDGLECHGMPTDHDICADFMRERDELRSDSLDSDSEPDDDDDDKITTTEAPRLVRKMLSFLEDNGITDFDAIYKLQDQCATISAKRRRQTKITEHINWVP